MNRLAKAAMVGGGAAALAFLFAQSGKTRPVKGPGGIVHENLPTPDDATPSGSGLEFASSLPNSPGPKREQMILDAVGAGGAMVRWSFVVSQVGGREAIIPVMARALQIGEPGAAWRVICNYRSCQALADHFSCVMMTPLVQDLIWLQSDIQLDPLTRPWSQDGTMALTSRSIEQSMALDKRVPFDQAGLVANEGKQWAISKRLYQPMGSPGDASFDNWNKPAGALGSKHNGPNYGWNQKPNGKPIQGVGLAHDMSHTDYSQMVQLMSRRIIVDGEELDVGDVLSDPVLCSLVSNEGPLPSPVHPDLLGVA